MFTPGRGTTLTTAFCTLVFAASSGFPSGPQRETRPMDDAASEGHPGDAMLSKLGGFLVMLQLPFPWSGLEFTRRKVETHVLFF